MLDVECIVLLGMNAGGETIVNDSLPSTWRGTALRGLCGILFGLAALLLRDVTLTMLAVGFGAYALIDGALAVLVGTRLQSIDRSWLMEGISGVTIGSIAILWAGLGLSPLLHLIAFWALATGLLEVSAAIRWRRHLPGGLSLRFSGLGSLLLGAATLFWPSAHVDILVILLGCRAMLVGATMLALAFQLRRSSRRFASFHGKHLAADSR